MRAANRSRAMLIFGFASVLIATMGCESGPPPGPTVPVSVSGHAFRFSQQGGRLGGAEVTIVELPGRRATTASDGAFRFDDLPSGSDVTFLLRHPEIVETQTGTFRLGTDPLERVAFQAPDRKTFNVMVALVGVDPWPDRCQIATTVTRRGNSPYDDTPGTHGEPGATVAIEPSHAELDGPVYFNLVRFDLIYPDRKLTATTDDGGVLYLNAPPGEYRLRAQKVETTFTDVRIKCIAGRLVNAAPPWGLQAVTGGVGPRG